MFSSFDLINFKNSEKLSGKNISSSDSGYEHGTEKTLTEQKININCELYEY